MFIWQMRKKLGTESFRTLPWVIEQNKHFYLESASGIWASDDTINSISFNDSSDIPETLAATEARELTTGFAVSVLGRPQPLDLPTFRVLELCPVSPQPVSISP